MDAPRDAERHIPLEGQGGPGPHLRLVGRGLDGEHQSTGQRPRVLELQANGRGDLWTGPLEVRIYLNKMPLEN